MLGALLSAVLSAANAYLGLFAGMTVSASIPAAVVSMGILRAVKGSILENNLVQTAASAGESAAAGAIFTLPALILLGFWAHFDLFYCAILIGLGGILGVLFTIFLRRALVHESSLPFPEGVATAEVLRAGHGIGAEHEQISGADSNSGLLTLAFGSAFGAVAKWLESGVAWSRAVVEGATQTSFGTFYGGFGVSPALGAVGYVVGFHVALLIFIGGVINWLCFVPFVAEPVEGMSALDVAWTAWSQKTRYLGVGAMTVGGLGALFEVRHSVAVAIRATFNALGNAAAGEAMRPETDRDLPPKLIVTVTALTLIPLFLLFQSIVGSVALGALLAILVLVFGFLFSSVAAYMAGLVGSSHNPVSGVTIATILFTSLFLAFVGAEAVGPAGASAGPAAAILVGSIVCTAAAIGGDNMQDLKAGAILGATPARQQIMQLIGVVAAALALGPVLELLLGAYGFGAPSAEFPHALRAPQATLMAAVADGVFGGTLPWGFFFTGAALGAGTWLLDLWLMHRQASFRTPVLAVALGLYLPWELSGPVLLGGLIRSVSERSGAAGASRGVLAAAGLITGEALMGIVLAGVVATLGSNEGLTWGARFESSWLSVAILVATLLFLRRSARKA